MQLLKSGVGGALLRWAGDVVPEAVDIFSDGVHVLRQPLIRFPAKGGPVAGFADGERLPERLEQVQIVDGPTQGVGWGAKLGDQWTVAGEDTPFCYRAAGADLTVCRLDISRAAGAPDGPPTAGQTYYFAADTAQHRCGMGVSLEWLDATGKVVQRDENWRETGPRGGNRPSDYERMLVSGTCPAGAAAMRLVLMQGPPTQGSDGYIFFRGVTLTTEQPDGRPVLTLGPGSVEAPGGTMAILPLGDVVGQFAGPLEARAGDAVIALEGARDEDARPAIVLTVNGAYLEMSAGTDAARDVLVAIDGQFAGFFSLAPIAGVARAVVPLATSLLDGQAHWIEVRSAMSGETLHAGEQRIAATQTPPSVLQTFTSRIERPGLIPFADMRYEGLAATLERLAHLPADAAALAEVARAHRAVLRGPQPDQARFAPMALPEVEAPRFSIVVPVHNKFHLSWFCIASILYTCAGLPYEVVLVDDGSTDATLEAGALIANLRVVRHEAAQGFVGACTAGAAAARGEYIVFLNNDTEVVGRWLEELHLPFTAFTGTGMTGAKLVYPDGRLQEAGGIVWGNGRPWNVGRAGNPADPAHNYTRQVDYCSGAAIMVSRAAWTRVGGFSREFAPAYYEDTDLAFKLRDAGYRTVFAAKSVVIHYEGQSNGTETSGSGLKRFQEINRPKFEAKWRRAYRLNSPEGIRPELEKDRGQLGRALVLDYQSPRFDRDAGSYAISQEIRLLQGLGYKVTLATLNCAHLGTYTEAFERGGVEHLYAPFYSSPQDVIERRGGEFNLIYVHRYTTAEGLVALLRRHAPGAKVVLNCADLHFLRELRAARLAEDADAFERALKTRDRELAVFRDVDAVLTYSETEKAIIETYLGLRARVHLLPWIAPSPPPPRALAEREGLCFIGSYDHPPNRDAMEFFLAECWPAIRARDPDVVLHIAGSGFERFRPAVPDPRIRVVGFVDDASDFLSRRRLMVAPLRSGAGIKGKVIDAFNSGTPSVLSTVAAEGIVGASRHGIIARSAEEWVDRVLRLLRDDEAWEAEAAAARERIEDQFSYANGLSILGAVIDAVGLPQAAHVAGAEAEVLASTIPFSELRQALDASGGSVLPADAEATA